MSAAVLALIGVAVGGFITGGFQWLTRRGDRLAEDRRAFEGRVWDKKSESIAGTIRLATQLKEVTGASSPSKRTVAYATSRSLDELIDLSGSVEVWCGDAVRERLNALIDLLTGAGVEIWMHRESDRKHPLMEVDSIDLAPGSQSHIYLKSYLESKGRVREYEDALVVDLHAVHIATDRLIEASRADLRSPVADARRRALGILPPKK